MTIRYIFHAFIGTPLSDSSQVDVIHSLLFSKSPMFNYVVGGTKPFSTLTACFQCGKNKDIMTIKNLIIESPLMSDYVPMAQTGNQSKEDFAEMIFSILGIAGVIGTSNLLLEVLTAIPVNAQIDLDDKKDVMFAVLEAARKRAPVNTVNVILTQAKTMIVNGKETIIPAGTVVGGSIG